MTSEVTAMRMWMPGLALVGLLTSFPSGVTAQNAGGLAMGTAPATSVLAGQSAPEASGIIDLPKLVGPVTLDGFSDEAAWAGIAPVALTMYEPTFRGGTDRQIQVLVGYDDDALYVAARFYHEDPRCHPGVLAH